MNSNDNENRTHTLRFALAVATDDPEPEPFIISEFNMPMDALEDGLCEVKLPRKGLGKGLALAARIACQAIDKALKRHVERGGGDNTPEMLTTHIDPMEDLEKENR